MLIDDEGIVRFRTTGSSPAALSRMESEIKRLLKTAAKRPQLLPAARNP